MQNSSNDKIQSWQQRLDDFEDAPGNALDKNAAWEKLQQKKPVTKTASKKAWYWLAAACLAGLCFAGIQLTGKTGEDNDPVLVKEETRAVVPAEAKSTVIQADPRVTVNKKVGSPVAVSSMPVQPPDAVKQAPAAAEPLLLNEHRPEPAALVAMVDTVSRPTAPLLVKNKKLKVVHINELNPNMNAIAVEEGKPYFPVSFPTKEIYTNSSPDQPAKTRDNLVRIKLFP